MNVLCPKCNGGRTGEKSLRVWEQGGKTFGRCYRASCGWFGRFYGEVPVTLSQNRARTHGEPLSHTHEEYLVGRVGSVVVRRLQAFSVGSRIGLPIFSPQGVEMGYTAKDPKGGVPKSLTYKYDKDYALGAWYNTGGSRIYLVEDQLSACCVSTHTPYTGVALLGTKIFEPLVRHLCSASKPAYLLLDQDATRLAVEQALRWRSVLDLQAVPIKGPDLKDRTPEEIRRVLG